MKLKQYSTGLFVFHCPGCGYSHPFHVAPARSPSGAQWSWNGSMESPTFLPSLLVWQDRPEARCHSLVTDGKIRFLADCFHALKGQTVDIPDWETPQA